MAAFLANFFFFGTLYTGLGPWLHIPAMTVEGVVLLTTGVILFGVGVFIVNRTGG